MANYSAARLLIFGSALFFAGLPSRGADNPDSLITNGGFEAGMQIWKGDGKIELLPDGNRVCEIEASKSRVKRIYQDFHMKQLQQVEVVFRARSIDYAAPGFRISIHQPGSGSVFWNKELPADGSWRNYRIKYTRTNANVDLRELNIETLLGTGKMQIDDVEVREPSKAGENESTDSGGAPPPAATTASSRPSAPVVAPPGTFGSLEQLVKSAPPEALQKLQDSASLDEAVGSLNAYFSQNLRNKPLVVRLKANTAGAATDGHNAFRIGAFDTFVPLSGGGLTVRLWAYFPPDSAPPDGRVFKGSDVTVSGVIGRCDITTQGALRLNIDLQQSKMEAP